MRAQPCYWATRSELVAAAALLATPVRGGIGRGLLGPSTAMAAPSSSVVAPPAPADPEAADGDESAADDDAAEEQLGVAAELLEQVETGRGTALKIKVTKIVVGAGVAGAGVAAALAAKKRGDDARRQSDSQAEYLSSMLQLSVLFLRVSMEDSRACMEVAAASMCMNGRTWLLCWRPGEN